jgi:hypothetical protein
MPQAREWRETMLSMKKTLLKTVAAVALASMLPPTAQAAAVTLKSPYGLAVDQNSGSLYITDPSAGQIAVFNPATKGVSSFIAGVPNVVSVAVNSNGLVYAGIVGATSQINVYNPQAQLTTTLPVAPGDSPTTMTFDADNMLYQAFGVGKAPPHNNIINVYTNDTTNVYNTKLKLLSTGTAYFSPYNQLHSYTILTPGTKYALAYDNGHIFVINGSASADPNNIYDTQLLLSGNAYAFAQSIGVCPDQNCSDWKSNHWLRVTGSSFAAAVDAHHNIFYTDPDANRIAVAGKTITPTALLTNLPSQPFGTAFDKTHALLYVAFPEEHLIRAYRVSYTPQNGVQMPTLSKPVIIN